MLYPIECTRRGNRTAKTQVTQLREQRENRTLQRLQKQPEHQHLKIPDKLGPVPFSKAWAELLFDGVKQDYKRTSRILSTYLPLEQWTEVLAVND